MPKPYDSQHFEMLHFLVDQIEKAGYQWGVGCNELHDPKGTSEPPEPKYVAGIWKEANDEGFTGESDDDWITALGEAYSQFRRSVDNVAENPSDVPLPSNPHPLATD